MASAGRDRSDGAAAIVARIRDADAAREIAAEFESQVSAFGHLSEESRTDVLEGLQRSLRRWSRFLLTGVMPGEQEFEPLRQWTRARATEGVRLEDLLRSFGLAHQVGWRMLRSHARAEESEALLELAAALAQYVDTVSVVVTETYLAERELLVSEEERRTRSLLDRLCTDSPLGAAERELAERLGVPVKRLYTPFAIVAPGRPPHAHAALAARLRRGGWRLAVTQGDCVAGVTWEALELADVGEGGDVVLALGEATPRAELAGAREEVIVLAEYARRHGVSGRVTAAEYLLEILLQGSPGLLERMRARVLEPLGDEDHGDLARTLRTLIECRMDRTATSAELHIHRNTLAYRLRRIEELTGLELSSPRDLAWIYAALSASSRP